MKNTEDLTLEEIDFAFGVLMDSKEQEKLLNGETPEKTWALDYIYDSSLTRKLEKAYEMRMLDKELSVKEVSGKKHKI